MYASGPEEKALNCNLSIFLISYLFILGEPLYVCMCVCVSVHPTRCLGLSVQESLTTTGTLDSQEDPVGKVS